MRFFRRRKPTDDVLRLGEHDVDIAHEGDVLFTKGLEKYIQYELRLTLAGDDRGPDGHALLDHIASYVVQMRRLLKPGETYLYGFWMLKFFAASGNVLEIGEVIPGISDEFQPGSSFAMRYWREQWAVCDRVGAEHQPPPADSKAAVSPGLSEAVGVEGSRYGEATNYSGWVLIADGWQGEVVDLLPEHLYHLTVSRPDLVRYLGLPPGYRFHVTAEGIETDLEFDPEIA